MDKAFYFKYCAIYVIKSPRPEDTQVISKAEGFKHGREATEEPINLSGSDISDASMTAKLKHWMYTVTNILFYMISPECKSSWHAC